MPLFVKPRNRPASAFSNYYSHRQSIYRKIRVSLIVAICGLFYSVYVNGRGGEVSNDVIAPCGRCLIAIRPQTMAEHPTTSRWFFYKGKKGLESMKVVLIDDDPLFLFTLSGMLHRRGYDVLTYDNPLSCPIYTSPACPCPSKSSCPDIIISDVNMPKVNGMQFIEAVYKKGCKCQNVALIAGKEFADTDLNRMAKFGTRFFTKPFDFDEFDAWLVRMEQTCNRGI